jgi:hypothetical protein
MGWFCRGGVVARFESGWIKVYRRAFLEDLGDNPYLFSIWVGLLSMATRWPTKIQWNGERREVPAGSVLFGLKELATRWSCSRTTILKWLRYLESSERIILETCTRGCLATILNFEAYQLSDSDARTDREQNADAARTRREHEVALNGEYKNKEKTIGPSKADSDEEAFNEVYREYPKRKGSHRKTAALAAFRKRFAAADRRALLLSAVRAYRAECASEDKIGTPYVMQIATFLNGPWEEYAEKATAAAAARDAQPKKSDAELLAEIETRRAKFLGGGAA